MPGRALPAAQPHIELTTIITVPVRVQGRVHIIRRAQFLHANAREFRAHRRNEWFRVGHESILLDYSPRQGVASNARS